MPKLSAESAQNLATCHKDLIELFVFVSGLFDCKVLEGKRSIQRQQELYADGKSRTMRSKHLTQPSLAVDVLPYPVDYDDIERMHMFAGFVKGAAARVGVDILWGGDWDDDTEVLDEQWRDLAHFELKEPL